MFKIKWMGYIALLAWAGAQADCGAPDAWMERINQRVTQVLEVKKSEPTAVKADAVIDVFRPYLNVELFSKKIVGRAAWQSATPLERKTLQKKLYDVMLRDYAESIVQSLAGAPKVYRVRGSEHDHMTTVTVAFRTQRDKILLASFALMCEDDRAWNIYDISVQGIRLTDLQQEKFKSILKQEGVAGLNKHLDQVAEMRG